MSGEVFFFLDYDDGSGQRFSNSPGLLTLVGHTRSLGFCIRFYSDLSRLLADIRRAEPAVVAMSSMERLLPRTVASAREIRAAAPSAVMFLGGPALESFALELAAHLFDVVVVGEAEHTFGALLEALFAERAPTPAFPARVVRRPLASAGGVLSLTQIARLQRAAFTRTAQNGECLAIGIGGAYLRDSERGDVVELQQPRLDGSETPVGSAPLACELDGLTMVPWDIIRQEGWKHFEFYAQRGCKWGRCNFCAITEKNIRAVSPGLVCDVAQAAVAHGMEMMSFADDLFVQDRQWLAEVLARLEAVAGAISFRAQTMANASVVPFLARLKRVGFVELSFGVETLVPARAERLGKTHNGLRYVAGAELAMRRTASAGIFPVAYMILVDPSSTLREVALEVREMVRLLDRVYTASGVLPKLSFSLVMLPVAGTVSSEASLSRKLSLDLGGGRSLSVKSEFLLATPVATFVKQASELTSLLPKPRENVAALRVFLEVLSELCARFDPGDEVALTACAAGLSDWHAMNARLLSDAEETAHALVSGDSSEKADFRRFGGAHSALERMATRLSEIVVQAGTAG